MKKIIFYISILLNFIFFALILYILSQPKKKNDNLGEDIMLYIQQRIIPADGDVLILGGEHLCYANWAELMPNYNIHNKSTKDLSTKSIYEVLEDLKGCTPSKLILQLGFTDIINGQSVEEFSIAYRNNLNDIKTILPNTEIIILSLFPVNELVSILPYKNINNQKIIEFNNAIIKIAEEEQLNHINIYNSLSDNDKNSLPRTFCMKDGYHLNSGAYYIIKDRISSFLE